METVSQKRKIALVVQRYGLEVNGGAEMLARTMAEHLKDRYDIEVLTSKAVDYVTWKDEYTADEEVINEYKNVLIKLKEALNTVGWDGKWYRRAFFKDNTPLGSSENDECKIDGISQSWAVISGAGEHEKCVSGLDYLDNYLVDKENMVIKLLTPPFSNSLIEPGYIKSYIPGVRENGGQYTHGDCCC